MLGSTGSTGTTKDTEPFSSGRQFTWSFIKESILGFDYELRSLESAHQQILSQQFFFDVGFTICLPNRTPCGSGVRTKNDLSKCVFLDQKIT